MKLSRPTNPDLSNIYASLNRLVDELETTEPWRTVNATDQPVFENGYTDGGTTEPVAFYKDALGIVRLRGRVTGGTASTPAFTLPPGYRPSATVVCPTSANNAYGEVHIVSSGGVYAGVIGSNLYVVLDGITFRAT
jgi:hypothetical protein